MPAEQKKIGIVSWNVNGIRAAEKKGFLDWLRGCDADIIAIQETKAHPEQLSNALIHPAGYESYWNAAIRKGYSGTAIYTRLSPIFAQTSFGDEILDGEGRLVLLEFEQFYFFGGYFPNGGQGPERIEFKLKFYDRFLQLCEKLRRKKPVIFAGDINTAHHEIDLARPKENANNTGFLRIERDWLDEVAAAGFVDSFRVIHPTATEQYSWWDMKTAARERNVGWRIDQIWVSGELAGTIADAWISQEVLGSDHCPVGVTLQLS